MLLPPETSCLQCPPSLFTSPSSPLAFSGVCPGGCCGYESAVPQWPQLRVVWAGGCCPSSCRPPCPDFGPSPCLRQVLCQLRSLLSCCPSLVPSASPSSPPLASCLPPPAAPCAFAHAPFAARCVREAAASPGGCRTVNSAVKCPQPQGTKGGIKSCKTNLLLSVGKPVYTWSCFGL